MPTVAAAGWLILLFAVVLANIPFLTERRFGLLAGPKGLGFRCLELLTGYILTIAIGFTLESTGGQRAPQNWEFYGITLCLFIVLAFPGFTWRYLRRGRVRQADSDSPSP